MFNLGPTELILILVIIVIFFGVGRLPEVFGAVGKGLREFRKAASEEDDTGGTQGPSSSSGEPRTPDAPAGSS